MNKGLSVVIPAYNEENRIGSTLEKVVSYLSRAGTPFEVLVVDDGSSDGTVQVVRDFEAAKEGSWDLRLLCNGEKRGKGFSVRRAMLEARFETALLTDADLSAPIEELEKLRLAGCDIAFGSRDVPGSHIQIHQSWLRENGGKFFNLLVRLLLGIPYRDTQCGFKLFRIEPCQTLFERQRIMGFSFDVEVLYLAWKEKLSLKEVPIVWNHDSGSKVSFLKDGTHMLMDLFRIRWNTLLGRY